MTVVVVNEENLIGLMTLEKHGLIIRASPSSKSSSKSKSKSSSTFSMMVTSGCGEVLGNIENGLLLLPGEETATKEMNITTDSNNDDGDDDDIIEKKQMTSYWESSSNPKKIKFDNDGYVTYLDIGGKRLHKGFPCNDGSEEVVFTKFSRLQTLNIAGTDLPIQDILKILNSLKSSSLECLYCGGNGLGNEGIKILAEEWLCGSNNNNINNLQKLDLRYNDIGNEGMKFMCDSLLSNNNNNKIEYLYLEGNNIGDDGVMSLSELIKSGSCCSLLREIYLGANQIQSKGAEYLASCFKYSSSEEGKNCCHLTKLYLEGNNIGLDGANAFSNVLEELDDGRNTTLKYLYVDNNNIGKDGSNRLAKALKSNTTIIEG